MLRPKHQNHCPRLIAAALCLCATAVSTSGQITRTARAISDSLQTRSLGVKIQGDLIDFVKAYVNGQLRKGLDRRGILSQDDYEMRVQQADTDDLHYIHVRLNEFYKGIPVEGSAIVAHTRHVDTLYKITGEPTIFPPLDAKPTLSLQNAIDVAVNDGYNSACQDPECTKFGPVTAAQDAQIRAAEQTGAKVVQFSKYDGLLIYDGSLAYRLIISTTVNYPQPLLYIVDAHSGNVLAKSGMMMFFDPPSNTGCNYTITGSKLSKECDGSCSVSLTGWKDTSQGTRYFLYHKRDSVSKVGAWGIFDWNRHTFCGAWGGGNYADSVRKYDSLDAQFDWIRSTGSDWGTNDRMAISAAKNTETVLKYLADSVGRFGINNKGDTAKVQIRCAWPRLEGGIQSIVGLAAFCTADTSLYVGTADETCDSLTVLDPIAHELGHALTFFTSRLAGSPYEGSLPITINESNADMFATAVEFAAQVDGRSSYPSFSPGRSDWLQGEDCIVPSGWAAYRDLRYPLRPQPSDTVDTVYYGDKVPNFTYYENDSTYWYDNDVHCYMGLEGFAFYLLAEGVATQKTNAGYPFGPFNGIGIPMAARVVIRANIDYCTEFSTYRDCYWAWRQATQDYVNEGKLASNALQIVDSAWKAVGVFPEIQIRKTCGAKRYLLSRGGTVKIHSQLHGSIHSSTQGNLWIHHARTQKGFLLLDSSWVDVGSRYYGYECSGSPKIRQGTYLDSSDSLSINECLVFRNVRTGQALQAHDSLGIGHVRTSLVPAYRTDALH